MRGMVDWKLIKPFWSRDLALRLEYVGILIDRTIRTTDRVFSKHLVDVKPRHIYIFRRLYALLWASRQRAFYYINHGESKLGWALLNCVPAGGIWRGLNLTEAGKMCGKIICPWCWYRKMDKIKYRIRIAFPKEYSMLLLSRRSKEAVYDQIQRLGFIQKCRQEVLEVKGNYVKVNSYRTNWTPGLFCTAFLEAGTVIQGTPLPSKMASFLNIEKDLIKAVNFPFYFLEKEYYAEAITYLKAMHCVKQFSTGLIK